MTGDSASESLGEMMSRSMPESSSVLHVLDLAAVRVRRVREDHAEVRVTGRLGHDLVPHVDAPRLGEVRQRDADDVVERRTRPWPDWRHEARTSRQERETSPAGAHGHHASPPFRYSTGRPAEHPLEGAAEVVLALVADRLGDLVHLHRRVAHDLHGLVDAHAGEVVDEGEARLQLQEPAEIPGADLRGGGHFLQGEVGSPKCASM